MKKSILILSLMILAVFQAQTQNSANQTTASIFAGWDEGDQQLLQVNNTKERRMNGTLQQETSSSYEARLNVAQASEKGYTIHWTFRNIVTGQQQNPILQHLARMTEDMTVIYKTGPKGAFNELINWEEIRDHLNKALDEMEQQYGQNPQVKAAFNQIRSMFQTRESIEQSLIKEIQLYHSLYGGEYTLNKEVKAASTLPNILGGEPFPAVLSVEMTELKPQKQSCRVKVSQRIDKEKGSEILHDFARKMARTSGSEMPDQQKLPDFEITDQQEYQVDLDHGWMKRVYNKRTIRAQGMEQIQTYEIVPMP